MPGASFIEGDVTKLLVAWEGIRMRPDEIAERFSTNFTIEHTANMTFVGKRFGRRFTIDNARWYRLRRNEQ